MGSESNPCDPRNPWLNSGDHSSSSSSGICGSRGSGVCRRGRLLVVAVPDRDRPHARALAPATSCASVSPTNRASPGAQPARRRASSKIAACGLQAPAASLDRSESKYGRSPATLEQVRELVVVDVADHADVQPARAQRLQRLDDARAELEVALVQRPLEVAEAVEVLGIRLDAEAAHACRRRRRGRDRGAGSSGAAGSRGRRRAWPRAGRAGSPAARRRARPSARARGCSRRRPAARAA